MNVSRRDRSDKEGEEGGTVVMNSGIGLTRIIMVTGISLESLGESLKSKVE